MENHGKAHLHKIAYRRIIAQERGTVKPVLEDNETLSARKPVIHRHMVMPEHKAVDMLP